MARARLVVPAVLLGFACAVASIATARQDVGDPDVFWIAAAGRETLAHGAVPRINGFSFVDGAHPWVMHEWLFGPPFAIGLRMLGAGFFLAFGLITATIIGALVTWALLSDVRRPEIALGISFLVAWTCDSRLGYARPTYSSLVLPLAMAVLAFRPNFGRAHAIAAIALAWIWANAHGSFPLGWVILAAALVDAPSRTRAIALAGAFLVSFVNPYGLALHRLVIEYAIGREASGVTEARRHILEFAPIWRASYLQIVPTILVVASCAWGVAGVVLIVRRRYVARAALVVLLALAGLLASRHVALAALLGPVLLAPAIDDLTKRDPSANTDSKPTRWTLGIHVPGMLVALAVLASRMFASAPNDLISPSVGGSSVVDLVRSIPDGTHVYTPLRSAGLVIWEGGARNIGVLYDSRNDCYSAEVARWALSVGSMSDAQILEGFDRFGVQMVLVPTVDHVEHDSLDVVWKQLFGVAHAPTTSARWVERARSQNAWVLYERAAAP
jgi:hypothetical protein